LDRRPDGRRGSALTLIPRRTEAGILPRSLLTEAGILLRGAVTEAWILPVRTLTEIGILRGSVLAVAGIVPSSVGTEARIQPMRALAEARPADSLLPLNGTEAGRRLTVLTLLTVLSLLTERAWTLTRPVLLLALLRLLLVRLRLASGGLRPGRLRDGRRPYAAEAVPLRSRVDRAGPAVFLRPVNEPVIAAHAASISLQAPSLPHTVTGMRPLRKTIV
jgi:hypothetical protein